MGEAPGSSTLPSNPLKTSIWQIEVYMHKCHRKAGKIPWAQLHQNPAPGTSIASNGVRTVHGQAWCPYVVTRVSGWGFISTGVLVQRWGKENRHLTTWFHSCSGAACVSASKSFCLCPGAWRELSSPLALGSHRVLLSPECVTVPCQSDGGVWGRRRESPSVFTSLETQEFSFTP